MAFVDYPRQPIPGIFSPSLLPEFDNPSGMFHVSGLHANQGHSKRYRNSWSGSIVGIATPGSDAQGMNAAICSAVRMGHYLGCSVINIKNGFRGMVEGGDNFELATWLKTQHIVGKGGTVLKSFKCSEFSERSIRLKAARNLVENNIFDLIVIGGDGTLRGISALCNEWVSLLRELEDKSLVTKEVIQCAKQLKVVSIVSSITNDVCGTDMSIGADSATQRILDAMDAILTNASSSQTAFIIEVMGKHSGYLALASGVASDASMIFIPEWPPRGDWKEELCSKVKDDLQIRQQGIMIIKSEGAIDNHGRIITSEDIANVLKENLKIIAETTVLGHFQSGGVPTAYDRLLGIRMGSEAMLNLKDLTEACVISIFGSELCSVPLEKCLEQTNKLMKSLMEKNFSNAVRYRGKRFQTLLSSYVLLHSLRSYSRTDMAVLANIRRIGIIQVGLDTLAQCIACKAVVGYCQSRGYAVVGIKDGFDGLMKISVMTLTWNIVKNWTSDNDCLGSGKNPASFYPLDKLDEAIHNLSLSGLVILGSFSAYESLCKLFEGRMEYRNLGIPMCLIPTTILNNIPGTDVSVGSDSALNELVTYCDKMTRVAHASKNYVYIIETMTKNTGYLNTMAAVCSEADAAYIRTESFNLNDLLNDANHIVRKIKLSGVRSSIVLVTEAANNNYNTDFIHSLFADEGKGIFSCKKGVMGNLQLGGHVSASDRQNAIIHGFRAAEWLLNYADNVPLDEHDIPYDPDPKSKVVLCESKRCIKLKTIARLICETDFNLRIPTFNWWMKMRPLMRVMAQHFDVHFCGEGVPEEESDIEETRMFDMMEEKHKHIYD